MPQHNPDDQDTAQDNRLPVDPGEDYDLEQPEVLSYEPTDDDLPPEIGGTRAMSDIPASLPAKRGPGRPRKHPLPATPVAKSARRGRVKDSIPGPAVRHFPRPPIFHFKDDNPGVGRQPGEFFRYCKKVADDPDFADRIMLYIYRIWPVMKEDSRQIEKSVAIPDYEDIVHRYGSGDYHLKLNDSVARRTIAMCTAKGFRDESRPPILDVDGLDMMDPLNQTYIKNARSRGVKFPGDRESEQEENDMANVQAVETLTGALQNTVDKVVDMAQRQANQANQQAGRPSQSIDQSAVEKGLDIVAQAATMGNQMIQTAINQASAAQGRATDPMAILDKAVEIATAFGTRDGGASNAGGHTEVLEIMKMQQAQQQQFHDTLFRFQQDRINQLEHEMREHSTANNTALSANPPKTLIEQMNEMKAAKDTMRDVLGLGDDNGGGGGSSWTEHLPLIIQGLGVLGSVIATGLHNLAVIKSGQGVPMQPPGPDAILTPEQQAEMRAHGIPVGQGGGMPSGMPGPQSSGQPGPQSGNMGASAGVGAMGGQQDMLTQYHQFLSMIEMPLLKSFQEGESGSDFAEKLLLLGDNGLFGRQLTGQQVYAMVRENGQPAIMSLIRTYNPIWDVVRLTPQRWEQFMSDFFNAEAIWDAEEREDTTAAAKGGG